MLTYTFKTLKLFIFLIIIFLLSACTTGHCPPKGSKTSSTRSKVWVYKYDQSKQCQKTEGVSLDVMAKELAEHKIYVHESKKEYDGLMRVQVCGAYTGLANLFLINISDIDKALAQGFQQWDF